MITKSVAVSGTVGKQVFASTSPVILKGLNLFSLSASAYVKIRDGNASGEVVLEHSVPVATSNSFLLEEGIRFDKGMHVKVLGTGGVCYLLLD